MEAKERVILALDRLTVEECYRVIDELNPYVGMFKVGLGLINRGHALNVCQYALKNGLNIFYDAKFHDIPATVSDGCASPLALASVGMFTVHTLGGSSMLREAKKVALMQASDPKRRLLAIGVTLPTSMGQAELVELGMRYKTIEKAVVHLAGLAQHNGLDGVTASPWEARILREEFGNDFVIVTPGIRSQNSNSHDQKRYATAYEAIKNGSTYIVVGREIIDLQSQYRVDATQRIIDQVAAAAN